MKEKLLKLKKELLQKAADFIYNRLENTKNDNEFNYWVWQGLSLDYWCVERDIYLD